MSYRDKHQYLHKKIILIQILYLLLVIYLFGTVLYDSFVHALPFYYVLFFILGRLLGWVFHYTQVMRWDMVDEKVVKTQNKTALAIFISFMLFRLFILPSAVEWTIHPRLLSDALFLVSAGIFYSAIRIYSKQLNELVWMRSVGPRHNSLTEEKKSDAGNS